MISHLGQYGVPRPWYFPFQKSYWAGVFGCSKVPSKQLPMMSQNGYATVPLNCDGEDMGRSVGVVRLFVV